jgi:hypothetical protein
MVIANHEVVKQSVGVRCFARGLLYTDRLLRLRLAMKIMLV